ncbi:conjugal transfer protein TraH, partial [Comamonas thiooxydans]|uniref:conjugal transfer protein TraH n=1 Tax=Comamonas thiooxydans TaxID=363952 RepID=UPI001184B5C7
MRKAIIAFFMTLASMTMFFTSAQAASPTASAIFSGIGGTTTIDQGGAIHSQTRSIYSLGGGMTSFQGKRVSLLAVDPPNFSAGCAGISWHFGGFSFISMDEIRQLIEAIAQASLGVAVDLAMQVLCPQCYAVMSKLREISNMMRNAAADACKVAKALGESAMNLMGIQTPDMSQQKCGVDTA